MTISVIKLIGKKNYFPANIRLLYINEDARIYIYIYRPSLLEIYCN